MTIVDVLAGRAAQPLASFPFVRQLSLFAQHPQLRRKNVDTVARSACIVVTHGRGDLGAGMPYLDWCSRKYQADEPLG
jgi:hypothetical protein